MLAASEANDPSKAKASGASGRKAGAGSDDEAEGARHGRHGHSTLHDMSSGGKLAPEHVKGATGVCWLYT